MSKGTIIVVSAPSGAGKTTLLDHVRSVFPDIAYSISATTRPPRPGEVNGVHYFFLTPEEFRGKIAAGEFAEWQIVHGHYYGTPRRFVEETIESGRHVVMDVDVYGKKKFDAVFPQATGILILPPSSESLEQRLRRRNTDGEEQIRVRLSNAKKETEFARESGKYEYILVNDGLEEAKHRIIAIVREITGQ